MKDEMGEAPVEWEQFSYPERKEFVEKYYPEGEPSFRSFTVVPYMFKDAIRSYVMGFRVGSHLASMAAVEKLLAEETGKEHWKNIRPAAEEMNLIEETEKIDLLREAYNSDKHFRDRSNDDHVAERVKAIAARRGIEGGHINTYAFLEYEAEDALKILLQLLPRLDCVEIDDEPRPFSATPWR